MGQYYHPINVDKKEYLHSHDFDAGLKLMEHSYLGNDFVNAVEVLLTRFGSWYKCSFVWAGDYADGEGDTEETPEAERHPNLYSVVEEKVAPYEVNQIALENKIDLTKFRYIVNHTKKVFVDKEHIEPFEAYRNDNDEPVMWKIHPLPLLTSEGNGRGGGDYHGRYPDYADLPFQDAVGFWARDSISIEDKKPKEYKEVKFDFKE